MPIITLISDLGKDTHSIARAKAQLLQALPQFTIVDISHAVSPFLIDEAVYFASTSVDDFAQGTIHLMAVDADLKKYARVVACKYKGQIFVAADNGFLAMLTKGEPAEFFEVIFEKPTVDGFLPLKTIFAPIAIDIVNKGLENISQPIENILEKTIESPVVLSNGLRGQVVYVNNYHNAITNITRALFDNERVGRRFELMIGRFDKITTLSNSYNDVGEGDNLCFFNENGLLEIAVNKGKASQLLGLEKGKRVRIEFFAQRATSEVRNEGLF